MPVSGKTKYWVARDGKQVGPFTAEQLQHRIVQGKVSPDDQVWREGFENWQPLAEIRAELPPEQPPAPPPPIVPTTVTINHLNSDLPPTKLEIPPKGVYELKATLSQKNKLMKLGCTTPELLRNIGRDQRGACACLATDYIPALQSDVNKDVSGSYTRAGNNYRNWIYTANRLFASSAILARETRRARNSLRHGAKPPMELLTPWTEVMIAGFGVECLIKAVWLKNGNELVREGNYVGVCRNEGHQLHSLCDHVGIPLTSTERDSLRRLSLIIRSIGRYPIPRKAKEAEEVRSRWTSSDDSVVASFVERLKLMLD